MDEEEMLPKVREEHVKQGHARLMTTKKIMLEHEN